MLSAATSHMMSCGVRAVARAGAAGISAGAPRTAVRGRNAQVAHVVWCPMAVRCVAAAHGAGPSMCAGQAHRMLHTSSVKVAHSDNDGVSSRPGRDRVVRGGPSTASRRRDKSRRLQRPQSRPWTPGAALKATRARHSPNLHGQPVPVNLAGLPMEQLVAKLGSFGFTKQGAVNVGKEIHLRGAEAVSELQVAAAKKARLARVGCVVGAGRVVERAESGDGSKKWKVDVGGGLVAETVFLPHWGVLRVSSQVGCEQGCTFCFTGVRPMAAAGRAPRARHTAATCSSVCSPVLVLSARAVGASRHQPCHGSDYCTSTSCAPRAGLFPPHHPWSRRHSACTSCMGPGAAWC